jgi:hypothetical protein
VKEPQILSLSLSSMHTEVWAESLSPSRETFYSAHRSRSLHASEDRVAVWKALNLVSSSPFSEEIEHAELPERFTIPRFEAYYGWTDPVAHISHSQQRMALCRYNDPQMCRLFPSSLGEVALWWFNQLGRRTIKSWRQMAEAFVARFITNSRRSKGVDSLLIMKLGDNESIKDYSTRFWEVYNDTDGCGEDLAVRTFMLGLSPNTGLHQSLTKRPPTTLRKLMDRIEQFIRLEEDGASTSMAPLAKPIRPLTSKPPSRIGKVSKAAQNPTSFAAPPFKVFQTMFKEPI